MKTYVHPATETRFEVISNEKMPYRTVEPLYDCYGSPSDAKCSIYNEWRMTAYDMDVLPGTFGVSSYNCMFFTLEFEFADPYTGELMHAWITPLHNYVSYCQYVHRLGILINA